MSRNNWFDSLFARSHGSVPCGRQSRLAFEPLEQRTLLTTLTVDIGDPTANDPGDSRTLLGNEQTAYVEDDTWSRFRDSQTENPRLQWCDGRKH